MLVVRPVAESDTDAVLEITRWFAATFVVDEAEFLRSIAEVLADSSACFLLAELDRAVIGYVLGYQHPTLHANGPVLWIDELAVVEAHQRSGVGRALMNAIEDWACERGCVMVNLATRRAAGFYKAMGYEASAAYFRKLLYPGSGAAKSCV